MELNIFLTELLIRKDKNNDSIAEAMALIKKPFSHENEMTPKIIKNPNTIAIVATKQK
jgi:hypothetical protein